LCVALLAARSPAEDRTSAWRQSIAVARDLLHRNLLADAEVAYHNTERVAQDEGDRERLVVTRIELGYVLSLQSRLVDAEQLQRESLRTLAKLDPKHPAIAVANLHLCEVLWRQGRLKDAQTACEGALAMQQKYLGKQHSETLHTLNFLGGIHLDRGQPKAARRYLEEAIAGAENAGPNFQAAVLANMGRLQQDIGKLHEAEDSLSRALRLMEDLPGADVEATLTVLNNVALIQSRLGKHQQAELLLAGVVQRSMAALGLAHPLLASILLNHGVELVELKRFDEAANSMKQAIKIQRNALGPSSPRLAMSLNYYSRLLARTGRKEEARMLKSEAEAILEDHPGQEATVSLKELEMTAPVPKEE